MAFKIVSIIISIIVGVIVTAPVLWMVGRLLVGPSKAHRRDNHRRSG